MHLVPNEMTDNVTVTVRSPTRAEMQQVVDLNAEGWDTHLEILYDIYDHQPESSKVVVDSSGQVLSVSTFNI